MHDLQPGQTLREELHKYFRQLNGNLALRAVDLGQAAIPPATRIVGAALRLGIGGISTPHGELCSVGREGHCARKHSCLPVLGRPVVLRVLPNALQPTVPNSVAAIRVPTVLPPAARISVAQYPLHAPLLPFVQQVPGPASAELLESALHVRPARARSLPTGYAASRGPAVPPRHTRLRKSGTIGCRHGVRG